MAVAAPLSLRAAEGSLIASYSLGTDFTDSSGYGATTLQPYGTSESASFTGGAWQWAGASAGGSGLALEFNSSYSSYTLAFTFSYSDVGGWVKLMDFSGLSSDAGVYIHGGAFDTYDIGSSAYGGTVVENVPTHVLITRDGTTGVYSIYQNGSWVASGSDLGNKLILENTVYLAVDDNLGGEFSEDGSIAKLQVWDYVLSAGEISAVAASAIPEPSAFALFAGVAGLGAVAISRRRRS